MQNQICSISEFSPLIKIQYFIQAKSLLQAACNSMQLQQDQRSSAILVWLAQGANNAAQLIPQQIRFCKKYCSTHQREKMLIAAEVCLACIAVNAPHLINCKCLKYWTDCRNCSSSAHQLIHRHPTPLHSTTSQLGKPRRFNLEKNFFCRCQQTWLVQAVVLTI